MAIVGYARVSSSGQKLAVQREKLLAFGCDKLFAEKRSGLQSDRPQFKACLNYLREGDVLVVTKLDRLARSVFELHRVVASLREQGIGFRALDQDFDTTTKTGRLLFGVLALIAEFEADLRKERQLDGIKSAKAKGVRFGRPATLTQEQVEEMRQKRAQGLLIRELMVEYNLSKTSVYRLLSQA
jgi:DNA invertase Pin-like site-specific DNA recombinase